MRFWQWFRIYEDNYYGFDKGRIQVSDDGGVTWVTLRGDISGWSEVWSLVSVDISSYAGSTIQIAFYFWSGTFSNDLGWYIDDVSVVSGPVTFRSPEDFEYGFGDWSADNGLWEVGDPTVGPDSAHSGVKCAGTVLNGNYPGLTDAYLVSPEISLPAGSNMVAGMYFWHWHNLYESGYYGDDEGWILVSVEGGGWETVLGPFTGISVDWSQVYVNLSDYAGSTIRIAFYLDSSYYGSSPGWYVDDISFVGVETFPFPDIEANGSDGPLIMSGYDPLEITVALEPGDQAGNNADWWIVAVPPFGGYYWYTLNQGWVRSNVPRRTYGGPLRFVPPTSVLNMSNLPSGEYRFSFAVDDDMNGIPDATYLDQVAVTVW